MKFLSSLKEWANEAVEPVGKIVRKLLKFSDQIDKIRAAFLSPTLFEIHLGIPAAKGDVQKEELHRHVVQLESSAQIFERFSNNLKLHASNLNIHLQTIRNITGVIDDVNHLRYGLIQVLQRINHIANVINDHLEYNCIRKIEGVDISLKEGTISLKNECKAFVIARDLLKDEIQSLNKAIEHHQHQIEETKRAASQTPDIGKGVIHYLDNVISPKLKQAQLLFYDVRDDLSSIPQIPYEDLEASS